MRFVCGDQTFEILENTSRVLGIDHPTMKKFIELDDSRMISIAQALGLEELTPAISNLEPGLEFIKDRRKIFIQSDSPAPEKTEAMPACEICGKPTASKRHKTCSDECQREKYRRYSREYQRKLSGKLVANSGDDEPDIQILGQEGADLEVPEFHVLGREDAGGGDEAPL